MLREECQVNNSNEDEVTLEFMKAREGEFQQSEDRHTGEGMEISVWSLEDLLASSLK